MNKIDHIVIAAHSLQQGVAFVRSTLGIEIPPGGLHSTMGTHNHLMQLGNGTYLEVIAINPGAQKPPHPRWFNLDDALMRESIRHQPRLITWVMGTDDIQQVAHKATVPIGTPTQLERNSLSWQLGIPADGSLLANGLLPYVIEWTTKPHPAASMADLDCRLESLDIYHNRRHWYENALASFGGGHLVQLHEVDDSIAPYLQATISTPGGTTILSSQYRV